MSSRDLAYPATPQNIDPSILQPSESFKGEVVKVLWAILFFIIVYVLLIVAAVALAAGSAFAGIAMIAFKPMGLTIGLGLGMAGMGIMVLYFLFKFLFTRTKTDRSGMIELKEADQPLLFAFIRKLTQETKTPFPKRIYVYPEVNAAVFYDSSFWSMFFPIRKNLVIGLGLVNAINLSEFKAILAHEFGHFSQRSMKLGSYVYNVNHIIYNLLYDNEGYGRSLETWGSLSGIFSIFATITVKIVQGIQWILQGVYTIINKQYLSLSREMEFHADTVAASVSGSEPLITSLNRMELVDTAFNELMQFYNYNGKEGIRPDNLYPQHFENMLLIAKYNGAIIQEGLPVGETNSLYAHAKPRINFKDQWASHPSNEDRELNLRKLNIPVQRMSESAWAVFVKPELLQKEMTDKLYPTESGKEVRALDLPTFITRIESNREKFKIDDRYRRHFDHRDFTAVNLEQVKALEVNESSLANLLTDHVLALPYRFKSIATDLDTLQSMKTGELPATRFEFDGQKMHIADTFALQQRLEKEMEEVKREIEQSDERFIAFFLNAADRKGHKEQLVQQYTELLAVISASEEDHKRYVELVTELMPLYQGGVEMDHAQNIMEKVRLLEVPMKERLEQFINSPDKELLSEAERERVAEYVEKDRPYFSNSIFLHNAFGLLTDAMSTYSNLSSEKKMLAKKQVLESQLQYLE